MTSSVRMFLALLSSWLICQGCTTAKHTQNTGRLMVQTISTTRAPKNANWDKLLPTKQRTLAVFMTTWCESCKRKQPDVLRWARMNRRDTKTVFIISGSPLKEVVGLAKARAIPSPLILVVNDERGNVAKRYQINATPTYVLLSPKGKPVGRYHSINDVPDAKPQ